MVNTSSPHLLGLNQSCSATGFLSVLQGAVDELTVVGLAVSSAVGAAVLGAKAACLNLPIDYQGNVTVMEHFTLTGTPRDQEKQA